MIKAIVFDLGGVVYSADFYRFVENACIKHGKEFTKFFEEFRDGWNKTKVDKMSCADFYKLIADRIGCSIEEAKSYLVDIKLDERIKKLILDLKKNYKIGILTNTIEDMYKKELELWNFEEIAEAVVSNRDKVKKPDNESIDLIIKKLGVEKDEIVFVDDSERTIEAYSKYGIKCIKFENYEQLAEDLKKLGVEVGG
ncbi:MAG: HAD-IA family hydrolase [Candidatus Woesearchaeota archaeon]